jgi:predicted MPP superfamily phosphohydrolase
MPNEIFIHALIRLMVFLAILFIFMASQLFWMRAVGRWGAKIIPHRAWRISAGGLLLVIYTGLFFYNFVWFRHHPSPTRLTVGAAVLQAPFAWWALSSLLGFAMVAVFWLADRILHFARMAYSKAASAAGNARGPEVFSPARRQILKRVAMTASAAPFAACAYGLTIGRLDVETTQRRIHLARLPKAFDGFRIAQLSDLHIGPFMTGAQIRRVVQMTNDFKADLIVLTGDYVIWDPTTQGAAVEALAGLRAPFGVIGCLGNHELWTGCEASITRLFAERNIRILRHQRWPVQSRADVLNLIGVDYQSIRRYGPRPEGVVPQYLAGVDRLMLPSTANILLSHNPNTFDRAAELGIDLSLAGHTHGGQVSLEFINKNLSPSRLITDYVRGWFQKPGGQLYVNRGIGTIGVPIRFDAPPEITVFELVREA